MQYKRLFAKAGIKGIGWAASANAHCDFKAVQGNLLLSAGR
jgi:hypothetical protein